MWLRRLVLRGSRAWISVRGGGHNGWGAPVGTGGMMIHLGGLNGVSVDPAGLAGQLPDPAEALTDHQAPTMA